MFQVSGFMFQEYAVTEKSKTQEMAEGTAQICRR